jgi:hypothetical protein
MQDPDMKTGRSVVASVFREICLKSVWQAFMLNAVF